LNTLALALALPGGLISPSMTALISNGSAILASLNGIRPIVERQLAWPVILVVVRHPILRYQ
jgi:hypothetical protein